jgi:chitin disaccharide deacetylase
MPLAERVLIVNADDFGLSRGVNRGVVDAHENGVVTSASLMVRQPGARAAAEYAREHSRLGLGLHFDIAEWKFVGDRWTPLYEVVPSRDASLVEREARRQVATFRALVGDDPTHVDSHQHVHRSEPVRSVLHMVAQQLGVPLRECTPAIAYCGRFYGQTGTGDPLPENITLEALLRILAEVPVGVTELGCHPGLSCESDSGYGEERSRELAVLCAPEVRAALSAHGIALCSFRDITASLGETSGGSTSYHRGARPGAPLREGVDRDIDTSRR